MLSTLARQKQGLSEYELLMQLRETLEPGGSNYVFPDHYTLFKEHFLLFNQLYRLKDKLLEKQSYYLEISPLNIKLRPYRQGIAGLAEHDSLREYYLDITNMESTTAEDVDNMLASFWIRLQNNDQREQALAELGLTDPVDDETIRHHYRKLVMQHHPDRGGDNEQLQIINHAMSILRVKSR